MLSIKWSNRAVKEKSDILRYWVKRNGTETYSEKIEAETDKAINLIVENRLIGEKVKNRDNVRRLTVMHDYAIYYTVIKNNLYILSFWDNRQDPERLEL
ncbi:Plasmid stabilisation system protein [Proteiniphilum saccharofermentans]|uniref:Plasmid stabilisation system protein n=1 Tax=Proteiniphilum saccharofermentans TaxID=1642647 RepID=A0A1R3T3I1_9BACT|nr:type II toxin-antitoxin system RelE/ParE family toxin [Proteiniphilum saccharofermentans]SCD20589.1 Plasmid stabilisation system protein [Proteiniphilum saccharofermentans]